jgi:hypothetical protein
VTGKLDIKVTIDEDIFPDLYRRLIEIANPRARVGVFKRLADDHVRHFGSTVPGPEAGQPATRSPFEQEAENPTGATVATEHGSTRVSPAIDVGPACDDALSRFQADAIADLFAGF